MPHHAVGRVLVVDDDDDIRDGLIEFLEDHGHTAVGASNGREAITRLDPSLGLPCVIILDLMMPLMDGISFRGLQLRKPALAKIPVIVVSAYKDVEARASALGVDRWLAKPLDLPTLLRMVEETCSARGPG